eukprot:TRINITY_DN36442_c0_g1_i1.p1 TRINITY_DN36442_c0_g1~~TRINITY_DN36442_c0_g1_i1.p1  ORF type:complete len:485 (+),score=57.29 TRINITY_DN36442_c0_g1_i1:59-1513(+)
MDLFKCCPWDAYISELQVDKTVIIKSKKFKVPYIIAGWLGVLCMFVYYFIFSLRFLSLDDTSGNTLFSLRQPRQLSWKDDMDPDMDSPDFIPNESDFEYCKHLKKPKRCEAFDEHDVEASSGTDSDIFIATQVEYIWQRRTSAEGGRRTPRFLWELDPDHEEPYKQLLVMGVGNYEVKLEHAVPARAIGIVERIFNYFSEKQARVMDKGKPTTLNSESVPGFIEHRNGSRQLIPCQGACDASMLESLFQTPDMASSNSAFYSQGADFISVQQLVQLAGVDLDEQVVANESYRSLGVSIDLEIEYDNMENFWSWPWGRKPKYTYRFEHAPYKSEDRMAVSKIQAFSENKRLLVRYTGILLQARITGAMGFYSLTHIVINLTVIASFVAALKIMVSSIAVHLFALYGEPEGVTASRMYTYYAEEASPQETEFGEVMARCDSFREAPRQLHEQMLLQRSTIVKDVVKGRQKAPDLRAMAIDEPIELK